MMAKELVLQGKSISKGIAKGRAVFFNPEKVFEDKDSRKKDAKTEIKTFKEAVKKSKKQILQLKRRLSKDNLKITIDILNTHYDILSDPLIIHEITLRIKAQKKSTSGILQEIISEYKKRIKDPFFREKIIDLEDVFKRIAQNLNAIEVNNLKKLGSRSVIISKKIAPSDIFAIDGKKVSAIISSQNSYEGHAAILARSKNIPVITNINIKKIKNLPINSLIVDANDGKIIINPCKKTFEIYEKTKKSLPLDNFQKYKFKDINFFANISSTDEIIHLKSKNISGIGLLRSELLFLNHKKIPSISNQIKVYKKISQAMKYKPVIIRLFDLGADKNFYNVLKKDQSCFFKARGAELLLKNKKILSSQLTAILRANTYNNLSILIPFVKAIKEIRAIKDEILKISKELKIKGSIKIGSMIETPIAALISDKIANEVDFLSIGSNDLFRYSFASDNVNYEDLNSSDGIFKLIRIIIESSKSLKKPLFLCGETIADKNVFEKLIHLKIMNFSVSLKHIPSFI